MGVRTGIQWADSTVNPTTGCDGCELWTLLQGQEDYDKVVQRRYGGPCYAGNLHETRLALGMPNLYAPRFTEVRLAAGRMAKAAAWPHLLGIHRPDKPWVPLTLPRLIFVGDMGDVFSKDVPFDYLADELIGAATSPKGARHVWMVLTKQPSRLLQFAPWLRSERGVDWPENVWVGTSVTGPKTLKRVNYLSQVPAAVRFLSLEPLWECVEIGPILDAIHWVIIGGESAQGDNPIHPFDLDWLRRILDACLDSLTAKPFVKQFGARPVDSGLPFSLRDSHGGDWDEWPSWARSRLFPRFDLPPSINT